MIAEASDTTPAVEIRDLVKTFRVRERRPGILGALGSLVRPTWRAVTAVDRLSLRIERGERVAFVGPNGAGKSTTIKLATGILEPDSGDLAVLGGSPWRDRRDLSYRIGTVFGQRSQLWYHLPARDAFDLLREIYDIPADRFRTRLADLVAAFDLAELLARPVRQLSLGQRMRCEIVASFLHTPEILFLDEPTIGLDVTAKATIREILREQSNRDGATILLTSHDTGDMEQVCDRVVVIHEGRLLLDRPVRELRNTFIRRKRITLMTAEPDIAIAGPGIEIVERVPYRTKLEVDTALTPVDRVVEMALAAGRLRDLTVEDPPMEEIVQAIYSGETGAGRA